MSKSKNLESPSAREARLDHPTAAIVSIRKMPGDEVDSRSACGRPPRRVGKPWKTVISAFEWPCAACGKPIQKETPFLLHPNGRIARHKGKCPTAKPSLVKADRLP